MSRRILTLDGGGIKGLFAASFLAAIEEQISEPLWRYFDLIVGTSTGGILALGIGSGMEADEIAQFYVEEGPKIFHRRGIGISFLKSLIRPKYEPIALRDALEGAFGDKRLGECRTRVVVPSMNPDGGEVYVFKTAHHSRLSTDYRERLVNAALATAAAPTYFPTHRLETGVPLVDGGVWANNPMGTAAVEAIGVLGWDRSDIQMLSIGCTTAPLDLTAARKSFRGRLSWATQIADLFLAGQSSGSIGAAQLLIGRENVVRINPAVPAGRFALDNIKDLQALRGFGAAEARKAIPNLKPRFFENTAEEFTPCYKLGEE